MLPLRYVPYGQLGATPNVVVDGAAAPSSRLVLSHWPGSPTPPEVQLDLSAEIAFAALDHPDWFEGLEVVSNNHYDQDGLVSVYALVDPEAAQARRDRAVDVARAGDFGTWTDRGAARLAMALAAYDDPDRSPFGRAAFGPGVSYDEHCGRLYAELLPRFTELLDHPEQVEDLWADEDRVLQAGLDALADGTVTVEDADDRHLAVVTVPEGWTESAVHRFTVARTELIHPLAVDRCTERSVLLFLSGDRVVVEQRYESWVQFRSRPIPRRQDLADLAAELTALETGGATWHGDAPAAINPHLALAGGTSTLVPEQVRATVEHFLATAPPAWDPAVPRR